MVISVNTCENETHQEDWALKDAEEAKAYAFETSHCNDVKSVKYENMKISENILIIKGEIKKP